jgi:hypothetical protein
MKQKMSFPGFTAESALGASGSYATIYASTPSAADVIPQLQLWRPGDCIPNCVCVQAEGCPCCGYNQPWFPWTRGVAARI